MKLVMPADGPPEEVQPGDLPDPAAQVLMREGEPSFQVRLDRPVTALDEVSGEILSALQRVTGRLVLVSRDGEAGLQQDVEFAYGPAVREGALIVHCDTDGAGYTPAMIDAMARVFVEELEPLEVPLTLSVPPPSSQPWTLAGLGGPVPEVE